ARRRRDDRLPSLWRRPRRLTPRLESARGRRAGGPARDGESGLPREAARATCRGPELVIFDGSAAAIPPVDTDARVLVTSPRQGRDVVTGYLNAYRLLVSDLVVATGGHDHAVGWADTP